MLSRFCRVLLSGIFACLPALAQGLPGIPTLTPPSAPAASAVPATQEPEPPKPTLADIPEHLSRSLGIIRRITQGNSIEEAGRIRAALQEIVAASETLEGLKTEYAQGARARSGMLLLRSFWNEQGLRLNNWQSTIVRDNQSFDQDLKTLDEESKFFAGITSQMDDLQIRAELRGTIVQVRNQIKIAVETGRKRQSELLDLQADITGAQIDVHAAEEDLRQAVVEARARLLSIDEVPIWAARSPAKTAASKPIVHSAASTRLFLSYVAEQSVTLAVLYVVFLLPLLLLRRRRYPWLAPGVALTEPFRQVLRRPYSSAVLPAFLFGVLLRGQVALDSWFLLIPLLRLLPLLIPANLISGVWGLAVLFAAGSFLESGLSADSLWFRWLLLLLIAATSALVWVVLGRLRTLRTPNGVTRLWRRGALLALCLLAIAFLGSVIGAAELSQYLEIGVVKGLFAAALLYGFYTVSHAFLQAALQFIPASPAAALVWTNDQLSARVTAILQWITGIYYLCLVLETFQLIDPFFDTLRSLMAQQIVIGSLSFPVGSICIIVATLSLAGLLSRFIRFGLAISLYERVSMPQGTIEVISKLIHYTLITAAFLIAMSATGIDLTRFSILMGALGVGIGFGLQNVVNNFISGLILLFERPINVGDTIKVGDVSGSVTDIGIRATRVQTWDGADIVVPNANLLSGQFTNWRGLSQRRGAELTIKVAAGNDPAKIIRILEETAVAHSLVLGQPPPAARFEKQGENSMDFILRYWALVRDVSTVSNDMYVQIFQKLTAEGVQLPVPQRELRIADAPGLLPPKS
ncbi:MAG TPA: mechanosensitive ion channel domain-containing protein [Bryobacteraceae bacterium]|nr:mechanosensitive ion channel domain-containing protein [Bryobacteraceae bacterium]